MKNLKWDENYKQDKCFDDIGEIINNVINRFLVLIPFTICLVLVRFKSSQDILQGVSKLDYYLKVSVFQKYKDLQLEHAKMSYFDNRESEGLTDMLVEQFRVTERET